MQDLSESVIIAITGASTCEHLFLRFSSSDVSAGKLSWQQLVYLRVVAYL